MKYLGALALFFGFMASANAIHTNYGAITTIKASDSQAYVYVDGLTDSFVCGGGNSTSDTPVPFVRFYWSTPQSDKMWSMLLAAQLGGKKVAFEGSCVSGYLSATTVYLKN